MEKVVLSIGGSVLVPGDDDADYISALAALLRELSGEYALYVVVGGGKVARYYIRTARNFGLDEEELDVFGIGATRLNARLLSAALGDSANTEIPETVEEAAALEGRYRIIVMGGTVPGHTTDAVAAMLLEAVGGNRLINATSVDGVYTADPKEDPGAVRLPRLTHERLVEICSVGFNGAGPNIVFDVTGARLLERLGVPLLVLAGRDLEALRAAIEGRGFDGTVVEG